MAKRPKPPAGFMCTPNEIIGSYLHCLFCIRELSQFGGSVRNESPESYARLSIGTTKLGFQVWCVRHDVNVAHIDLMGNKVGLNDGWAYKLAKKDIKFLPGDIIRVKSYVSDCTVLEMSGDQKRVSVTLPIVMEDDPPLWVPVEHCTMVKKVGTR